MRRIGGARGIIPLADEFRHAHPQTKGDRQAQHLRRRLGPRRSVRPPARGHRSVTYGNPGTPSERRSQSIGLGLASTYFMDSSRTNKATWIATIAVVIPTIYASLLELMNAEFVNQLFTQWGYPRPLMLLVGWLQLVGVVLLLIRATATFAAGVLAVIMVGAIGTLLFANQPAWALVTLVFLALLLFVGWERSRTRGRWIAAHPHPEQQT